MNDPIKYLITGAAIAIVCGAVGTMGGVWLTKEIGNGQSTSTGMIKGSPFPITIQTPGGNSQSVFSGPRTQPTGKSALTYSEFQKVQECPEVKAARDAFMEAQKKYSEVIKKAAESRKGALATSKTGPITIQVPPAGSTNGVAKTKL